MSALLTAMASAGCSAPYHDSPPGLPPAPGSMVRVEALRVGLPASGRASLLFSCAAAPQPPKIGSAAYAPDSLDASRHRWLRVDQVATDSAGMLAPDTLVVRAFDDATDEEIAFERGELDAAVFWPGELSARFHDPERGVRSRGALVCVAGPADTLAPPRADMEAFNREAFGGDLLPWGTLEPGAGEGPPARYAVDATVPAARHLERILARVARPGGTRTLKLIYMDQPVAAGDAASASWRAPGVTPLFAVRCAVLVQPSARDGVRKLGAHAFAELAPCANGIAR